MSTFDSFRSVDVCLVCCLSLFVGSVAVADIVAGPDGFGYVAEDIPFNLRDIRETGAEGPRFDLSITEFLPLPFAFNFYGHDVTEFKITSNGFITFDENDDTGCCYGDPIPDIFKPDFFIAGYWEHLHPEKAGSGATIRYQVLGEAPNRELVVGYYDVPHFHLGPAVTFEIILHEGSNDIELQYDDAPEDGDRLEGATAGIENADGTDGLEIAHGDEGFLNFFQQGFLIIAPATCASTIVGDENCDFKHDLIDFALRAQTWMLDCNVSFEDAACDQPGGLVGDANEDNINGMTDLIFYSLSWLSR